MLSAEAPIHQPLVTDGTAFFQLQEEMRNAFESTVLDLPRHMLIQYPHLVHDAHVAVVVAELTLAATRDTIRILAWLKSNAPQTKVIVVANRVPSGGALEISRKDFEHPLSGRSTSSSRSTPSSRRRRPSSASRSPKSPAARCRRRSTCCRTSFSPMRAKKAWRPNPRVSPAPKSLLGNLKSMLAKPKDKAA